MIEASKERLLPLERVQYKISILQTFGSLRVKMEMIMQYPGLGVQMELLIFGMLQTQEI
jgi:hypothetical protein